MHFGGHLPDRVSPRSILALEDFRMIREVRDPIYGYVYMNGFENDLIDTPEFQRIDRIFQMSTAHFAYPSGHHTRKSHCLGAAHLASKAFLRILYRQCHEMNAKISSLFVDPMVMKAGLDPELDRFDQELSSPWWNSKSFPELVQCIRLAGLLHDIGHSPFPHIFEEVCDELKKDDRSIKFDHERMGLRIIEKKLASKFKKPFSYEDVELILSGSSRIPKFLHEMIDGPYDCDKLDYLRRDSYHCGTSEYGSIDHDRIISGFRAKDKLLVSKSAIGALMNSFKAVQFMYTNVYYHKTSRIFDFMISDALKAIPEFVKDMISSVDNFLKYDSYNFMPEVKRMITTGTPDDFDKAKEIFTHVLNREKKYALIYSHPITLRLATDCEKELRELREEVLDLSQDLRTKVDHAAYVRPVGISPQGLLKWLTNDNIYDEDDHQTKNLEEVNRSYFRELTRYQVLFNVFADREIFQGGRFEHEKNQVKEHCDQAIEELERADTL
jgi:HD superfamily phosphohydrolase